MFRILMASAIVAGLAACTVPQQSAPSSPAGVCSTPIPGHHISPELEQRAQLLSGAAEVRVLRPGQVITREYRADRLNLQLDSYDVVVRVHCG
jgi:hypothetical protein